MVWTEEKLVWGGWAADLIVWNIGGWVLWFAEVLGLEEWDHEGSYGGIGSGPDGEAICMVGLGRW